MRPGREGPGCEFRSLLHTPEICSFNEAGARRPRMRFGPVSMIGGPCCFNEAGARRPRMHRASGQGGEEFIRQLQ